MISYVFFKSVLGCGMKIHVLFLLCQKLYLLLEEDMVER